MLSLVKSRFRFAVGFLLFALALALIPAASHALAGAPANSSGKQTVRQSNTSQQQQAAKAKPEASGPAGAQNFPVAKYVTPDAPITFQLDDGSFENSIGFGNQGPPATESAALWLNRFTPASGSFPITLTQVQIYWPAQNTVTDTIALIGKSVKLLVYNDSDGNGDPSNAVKLLDITATIAITNAFQSYPVNVTVTGTGDIYIGFEDVWAEAGDFQPRLFPAALDTSVPHQLRSFLAAMSSGAAPDRNNLGGNDLLDTIENISGNTITGNWGIRASGNDSRLITDTPTSTRTATATITVIPTPGCSSSMGWYQGPDLPTTQVRAVGVWLASLNRFYAMGGRSVDTPGNDLRNPRYYNPNTGTWTITNAQIPDVNTSNMVCSALNDGANPRIYCVGGSTGGGSTATNRVFEYDPVADTITTLASDPWPATANTLPGGFAVVNNNLYILGGFTISVSMSQQIWQFNPNAAAGARWTLKAAQVPNPIPFPSSNGLGYIPAAAVGTIIYTAGGSHWDDSVTPPTIADDPLSFSYDTVSDTVNDAAVPDLPAPGSGETRALNVGGRVWLIGGGRTTPLNPSSAVKQFDPANPGAGWVVVNSFSGPRRNFPVDIDPATGKIYLAGGYMPTTPTNNMQIYNPALATCTPTVGPTITQTPTFTVTPTSTSTPTPICPGSWTLQAPYPISIYDNGVTSLGGILYSFGGVSASTLTNTYKYDPSTNVWTPIAPLPAGRAKPGVVNDGTNIYIVGGSATNTIWAYNPASNTYTTTLPTSPSAPWAPTVAYLNGKIYKIAGCTTGACTAATNIVEAYDIATNTWSTVASLPQAIAWAQSIGLGNFVYVAGGTDPTPTGVDSNKTYRYDPSNNTWDDLAIADMPSTRWAGASVAFNGKWVLAGGVVNGDIDTNLQVWDPAGNTWSPSIDPMLQPRYRVSGATIGLAIYVPGGNDGVVATTTNQRYLNICAPPGVINGHVTWQGIPQPNSRNTLVTATLTLCNGGSQVYTTTTLHTDLNGNFTVTTGLPDGTYTWKLKGARHLNNGGSLTITGGTATFEAGLERSGNANTDNIVNSSDFTILKANFGQSGVDRPSDFDFSGVTNSTDFTILKGNFGQGGVATTCP